MKKIFLLIVICTIALNLSAQVLTQNDAIALHNYLQQKTVAAARKTTAAPPRWYNYGYAMDTSANHYYGTYMQNTALCATTIWNDTNGIIYDSGHIYRHNINVCEGVVFDPTAEIFNDDLDSAFIGQMLVSSADAYVFDSIQLFGYYLYGRTKTTIVDTIRLTFTSGSGGSPMSDNIFSGSSLTGGGYYGTDAFLDIAYDSITNTGKNIGGGMIATQDILLTTADWFDTLPNGMWYKAIPTSGPTGIAIPAGAFVGMTITFISGDPATYTGILSTPTPGDTIANAVELSGLAKYNIWRPVVNYYATYTGGVATPTWAPYQCPAWETVRSDENLGYWKRLPNYENGWDNKFRPTWAQNTGTTPSVLQYPAVSFHLSGCSTCKLVTARHAGLGVNTIQTVVNNVQANPNPARGELNISFDLSQASDVTVSLTNMLGQVVATQKVNNKAAGNVVFNTAGLAGGVYIYTLTANGSVTTGRVAVAK